MLFLVSVISVPILFLIQSLRRLITVLMLSSVLASLLLPFLDTYTMSISVVAIIIIIIIIIIIN